MTAHMTTKWLANAARAAGAEVREGAPSLALEEGVADSRKATAGTLFAAFRGETNDGNDYLDSALELGATAVVGERWPGNEWPERTIVRADDTRIAMATLAGAWRDECMPKVVGITGTVGKTTAKELAAAVLGQHFATHKSKENFNSREGLPLALVSLQRDHEVSVLEMAMDSPGEIAELCAIAKPDVGVVLNIGLTHVSKLGSVEAIAKEKLSLPRSLEPDNVAVVNTDDPRIAEALPSIRSRVISFGSTPGATLLRGPVESKGFEGCDFDVTYQGGTLRCHSPLPGAHVVPAALASLGIAIGLGLDFEAAAEALKNADAPGRMNVVRTPAGVTVLDDRYNSSPASLEGALRMLQTIEGRRVALLGSMAELGEYEESEHRRMGAVAVDSLDLLAATGEACKHLVDEARKRGLMDARWFETKDEAAQWLAGELRAGDTVLVKASRGLAFETLLPVLGVAK